MKVSMELVGDPRLMLLSTGRSDDILIIEHDVTSVLSDLVDDHHKDDDYNVDSVVATNTSTRPY